MTFLQIAVVTLWLAAVISAQENNQTESDQVDHPTQSVPDRDKMLPSTAKIRTQKQPEAESRKLTIPPFLAGFGTGMPNFWDLFQDDPIDKVSTIIVTTTICFKWGLQRDTSVSENKDDKNVKNPWTFFKKRK